MGRIALVRAFKRINQYTGDAERCENCQHFKPEFTVLINSLPRRSKPYCKLGGCIVNKLGICNQWSEK